MKIEFDDRDRASVLRDLTDEDEEVRRLAVERVAALPIDEAIPHLVERIGDTSWRVRKAAVARLVAGSGTTQVVDALIVALGDGRSDRADESRGVQGELRVQGHTWIVDDGGFF